VRRVALGGGGTARALSVVVVVAAAAEISLVFFTLTFISLA